jgi:hypothetical protein
MNPEPGDYWYCAKLILGFLIVVILAMVFTGCGTLWRVEYRNPKVGDAAVEFTLPAKEGYAK